MVPVLHVYDNQAGYNRLPPKTIFCFGANSRGRHGAGAALTAVKYFGAQEGVAEGLQGQSYAIPTRNYIGYKELETMDLPSIRGYVQNFLQFAKEHSELKFLVTPIGTGFAGYADKDIAPFFQALPANCAVVERWASYIPHKNLIYVDPMEGLLYL